MYTLAATKSQCVPASVEERNEVILRFYPLVQRIAYRTASSFGMPTGMETADLVSHGVLGLVEAWERFDDSRGVAFETYAVPRIKGAIVDSIRNCDWIPRKVRARAKRIDETSASLTNKLGRAPTREELLEALGADATAARKQPAVLIALEDAYSRNSGGSSTAILDLLADDGAEEPGFALEDAELRHTLLEGINRLGERDRVILTLYYFEGVPLADIAKVLGVTESRVSQLHMRALHTLRGRLREAS
jgi:RNA polymerase sigma factor for flagellar operon FliA